VEFLTIKNEEKLRKQVNKLESHISKIKTVEFQLQVRANEIQMMKDKHEEELKAIRQEMEYKFQQLLAKIDIGKLQF
jgi:division protein CdvB (Snf7/Vps24/ESCRT-III family)